MLKKITLDDVKDAIERSKAIIKSNEEYGFVLQQYKGFKYCRENPSLSVWESVEKILKGCGLV